MHNTHPHKPTRMQHNIHSHTWLVGILGLIAGLILMVYVPSLKAVSQSILLFAGFHIIGAIVLLVSLYAMGLRQLFRSFSGSAPASSDELNFGWGPEWMNGLAVAALVALSAAIAIIVALPNLWPLAFLAVLLSATFMVGNFIMRSFRSADHVVLPMVALLRSNHDLVLDAGCGAGRTTVALSRVLGAGQVVAVDRFDAGYIDDGGRALLDNNLRIAGITDHVQIESADLTALPFSDNHFDSAISTNVYDHLGRHKQQGLNEVFRVLKPGGRFLLAVWAPGWAMFTVANVLSFFLTSRKDWQRMAKQSGFKVLDQGIFNFAWFVLLEKPVTISNDGVIA